MKLANTRNSYGLISQLFHWVTAVLVLTLIALGLFMHDLPTRTSGEVVTKSWYYSLHKTVGVTVFAVAITRIIWTIFQPHPVLLNSDKTLESQAAITVHWILYGSIILMPLTGWLHHSAVEGFAPIWWPLPQDLPFVPKSPWLGSIFEAAHFYTLILLGIALALHISGALKHALIDKDDTLKRMVPGIHQSMELGASNPPPRSVPIGVAVFSFLIVGVASVVDVTGGGANTNPNSANTSQVDAGATNPATQWLVDMQNSSLNIEIIQSGKPVSGEFGSWNASIEFDPANLENASTKVDIAIASLSLGSVSKQAVGTDFLNVDLYPSATFKSDTFVRTGENAYEAHGQLTLAGQVRPVILPFNLIIEDQRAFVEGEVAISRLDFDIGKKGFSNDAMVGFDVLIKVALEAESAVELKSE